MLSEHPVVKIQVFKQLGRRDGNDDGAEPAGVLEDIAGIAALVDVTGTAVAKVVWVMVDTKVENTVETVVVVWVKVVPEDVSVAVTGQIVVVW